MVESRNLRIMRIVAISDTHNREVELPEGDLLIVAGDLTATGGPRELENFNRYLERQSVKFGHDPLVIAGNHDFAFEDAPTEARRLLSAAVYLEDELVEIDGKLIYGSPWTPEFKRWAFMKERGPEIRQAWKKIPDGLDVLVTHGPPHGILDYCGVNAGCEELLETLTKRLARPPRFHVFGHIHEGYGQEQGERTVFLNVSICNRAYNPINAPTVFEI